MEGIKHNQIKSLIITKKIIEGLYFKIGFDVLLGLDNYYDNDFYILGDNMVSNFNNKSNIARQHLGDSYYFEF